jgi:hypothetical protein
MKYLRATGWSPDAVGVGLGLLGWFAFATIDNSFHITTAVEHAMTLLGQAITPRSPEVAGYALCERQTIGWEGIVVGVLRGSDLMMFGERLHQRPRHLRCRATRGARSGTSRSAWPPAPRSSP